MSYPVQQPTILEEPKCAASHPNTFSGLDLITNSRVLHHDQQYGSWPGRYHCRQGTLYGQFRLQTKAPLTSIPSAALVPKIDAAGETIVVVNEIEIVMTIPETG